jgi:acetylornithine deacetylase/succinyl-diaminopimelate desuccinylase-like protein
MLRTFVEDAKRMIRTPATVNSGNEELANVVAGLLYERSFKVNVQQVMHSFEGLSKRQFNVVATLGDPLVDKKTRKGLLLLSHLDTPPGGLGRHWSQTAGDPYAPSIHDERIYGLGAAGAKLDMLAKIYAVSKFRERKLRMPIYVVGTCGSNQGHFGARYLLQSVAVNPKYVLVGEPTEMKLVTSHKGALQVRVGVRFQGLERDARGFNRRLSIQSFGRAAHMSSPTAGSNAILELLRLLAHAVESGFDFRLTRLEGGETLSQVPDRASVDLYCTPHQFEDFKRFFSEFVLRHKREESFQLDPSGSSDTGVRFLPESIFSCFMEILNLFRVVEQEISVERDEALNPPVSTSHLGIVRQGTGAMDLLFDLRLVPQLAAAEVEKKIAQGVQALATRFPNLNLTVTREWVNPALNDSSGGEWLKICQDVSASLGMATGIHKLSTSTEASLFQQAGYDTVVTGPGTALGNIHGPNEFVTLSQLELALAYYEKLVERVCCV